MSSYVVKKTPGDTEWFRHDRFGMFVHWGLYSMPSRHEWIKKYEHIPEDKYQKYFDYFDPDLYDPKEWARQAKAAGMKYVVFTTKHHEGFCMFDSKYTDYKCTNTRAGRDLLREFVDAFRAEGLRIGFYYSLLDWHHPEFPIDWEHPRCKDEDAFEQNKGRDIKKYAEYMRNQVTELLTNYGKIDIIWFDFSYDHFKIPENETWLRGKGKDDWEAEKLIELVRKLQPGIIINDRCGIEQDIWTPEQVQQAKWQKDLEGNLTTWEACETFSGSWGYHRDENTWKSPEMLIRLLINCVASGGNLIMNVGPTSRGYIDSRAEKGLKVYADWMKYNSRSIYGCTMAEPEFLEMCPEGCRMTQSEDGKRLYIHIIQYPWKVVEIPGLSGKVDYAQLLHDGSEVQIKEVFRESSALNYGADYKTCRLYVPFIKPDVIYPVIELFLK